MGGVALPCIFFVVAVKKVQFFCKLKINLYFCITEMNQKNIKP